MPRRRGTRSRLDLGNVVLCMPASCSQAAVVVTGARFVSLWACVRWNYGSQFLDQWRRPRCWFKRKRRPSTWGQLPSIPRKSKGVDPKQRPLTEHVPDLKGEEFQEDSVYQLAELARISGEMPRASVASSDRVRWGGYDWDSLRIAGLGRSVLIKLNYIHVRTPAYCLLNRATCRFSRAAGVHGTTAVQCRALGAYRATCDTLLKS